MEDRDGDTVDGQGEYTVCSIPVLVCFSFHKIGPPTLEAKRLGAARFDKRVWDNGEARPAALWLTMEISDAGAACAGKWVRMGTCLGGRGYCG